MYEVMNVKDIRDYIIEENKASVEVLIPTVWTTIKTEKETNDKGIVSIRRFPPEHRDVEIVMRLYRHSAYPDLVVRRRDEYMFRRVVGQDSAVPRKEEGKLEKCVRDATQKWLNAFTVPFAKDYVHYNNEPEHGRIDLKEPLDLTYCGRHNGTSLYLDKQGRVLLEMDSDTAYRLKHESPYETTGEFQDRVIIRDATSDRLYELYWSRNERVPIYIANDKPHVASSASELRQYGFEIEPDHVARFILDEQTTTYEQDDIVIVSDGIGRVQNVDRRAQTLTVDVNGEVKTYPLGTEIPTNESIQWFDEIKYSRVTNRYISPYGFSDIEFFLGLCGTSSTYALTRRQPVRCAPEYRDKGEALAVIPRRTLTLGTSEPSVLTHEDWKDSLLWMLSHRTSHTNTALQTEALYLVWKGSKDVVMLVQTYNRISNMKPDEQAAYLKQLQEA